jgi:hypothetical protein
MLVNTCADRREFQRFGIFRQRNFVSYDLVHFDLSAFQNLSARGKEFSCAKEPLIVTSRRMVSAGLIRPMTSLEKGNMSPASRTLAIKNLADFFNPKRQLDSPAVGKLEFRVTQNLNGRLREFLGAMQRARGSWLKVKTTASAELSNRARQSYSRRAVLWACDNLGAQSSEDSG